MSTSVDTYRDAYREEMDVSYAVDFGRDREPAQKRIRHPQYRRQGGAPGRVNGMHCRRQKRWSWGSGRGARMLNLRAFAGCLAIAVASLTANAAPLPVNIDYVTVNNVGNPANTNGWGAVSDVFKISKYETTNAQYVEFLNKVDAGGTNPNGVYSSLMGSENLGGIVYNAGEGSGSKYGVKGGGPVGAPGGTSYANMPVLFTSWFSAARFINWLQNGQQASAASMETGAYPLNNQTSGSIPARSPGATIFLPSRDQWYKAAFYDGSGGYRTYATGSNSLPTNTVTNLSLANAANFGATATPTVSPLNVGSYTGTTSFYGAYEMYGNATEYTDLAGTGGNTGKVQVFSGSWATSITDSSLWTSTASAMFRAPTSTTSNMGFRVAAVPEPGTFALAGAGFASLAGYEWSRRRKGRAPRIAA